MQIKSTCQLQHASFCCLGLPPPCLPFSGRNTPSHVNTDNNTLQDLYDFVGPDGIKVCELYLNVCRYNIVELAGVLHSSQCQHTRLLRCCRAQCLWLRKIVIGKKSQLKIILWFMIFLSLWSSLTSFFPLQDWFMSGWGKQKYKQALLLWINKWSVMSYLSKEMKKAGKI